MRYYFYFDSVDRYPSLWVRRKGQERVVWEHPDAGDDYSEYFGDWKPVEKNSSVDYITLQDLVKKGVTIPVKTKEVEEWLFIQSI